MKRLLHAMGFRRADEMEKSIQLKSMRWAWAYTTLFLLVWVFYNLLIAETVSLLPVMLFITQQLVLSLAQLIYRARMSGGGDDEEAEPRSFKQKIKEGPSPVVVQIVIVFVAIHLIIRAVMGWW